MKKTNLDYLFIDQVHNFVHLLTVEAQTKEQFLMKLRQHNLSDSSTMFFYLSTKRSDFDTIRLNETREEILFNQ